MPLLARDPRRAEDVDSRGPDHAGDACRYACLHRPAAIEPVDVRAFFERNRRWTPQNWESNWRLWEAEQDRREGRS